MSKSKPQPASESSHLSQALSVLNDIKKMVVAIEDPSKVLNQIAEDAIKVLGADIVDLYKYVQSRQEFTLPPVLVGERWHPYVAKLRIYKDDVVYKVIGQGKPQYFQSAQNEDLLIAEFEVPRSDAPDKRFVVREGVASSVSLPLEVGNEVVGVMFVNYRAVQNFDQEQKDLIESFSNLAAIVIHNSRLMELQNSQLSALKEIIDVMGAENPLGTILKQSVFIFSANHGSIGRLTRDGYLQFLDENAETSISEKTFDQSVAEGITGHVIRSRKPFRTGNVKEAKFYIKRYQSTMSEMAIPLKNAFGDIVGVLNLESDYPDFFSEEHEKLCVSFANAASAVIQQADLIDSIQSLHVFTETHNINELLDRILRNLIRIVGSHTAASINLYDKDRDDFYSYYGVGFNKEFEEMYLLIPPRKDGTGRYVLNNRKALYYEDVKNIPEGLPQLRAEAWDKKICSFAVLPLIYQDNVLGTLFIHVIDEPIKFNEDAIRILGTYADQTAIALHNSQHRIDIAPLRDILNATVAGNQNTTLHLIAEKAVRAMASDYASVWLGDKETGELVRAAYFVKPEEQEFLNLEHARFVKNQPSVNVTVYATGKSVIVNDVAEKEKSGEYHRIYEKARSEIAVPLVYQGEVIGTLNTESQKLGSFSQLDLATFQIFADIASSAIKVEENLEKITVEVERKTRELSEVNEQIVAKNKEMESRNEQLYNLNFQLQRKNMSFEALTFLAQQLTANVKNGEQEILKLIHQQASKLMDTDNMYIALYNPKEKMVSFGLAFVDGKSVDIQNQKGWEPRSDGGGRTEWIINKKTPILNYTKQDSVDWYKQPDAKEYIGETFSSWLGVPIMFGDEVMGVIATYNKTEEFKYSPDDLKVLALMGRQAAIALQNARLISDLDERVIELDKIRELGEDLNKGIQ